MRIYYMTYNNIYSLALNGKGIAIIFKDDEDYEKMDD